MRDIVGHDQQPAAFLVYLYLSSRAARQGWRPVKASLRMLANETGLSKSAVQSAIAKLQYRQLVKTSRAHRTAVPAHRVLRHWRRHGPADVQRSNSSRQFTFPSSFTSSQAMLGGAPRFGRATQPGFRNRTPAMVSSRGT